MSIKKISLYLIIIIVIVFSIIAFVGLKNESVASNPQYPKIKEMVQVYYDQGKIFSSVTGNERNEDLDLYALYLCGEKNNDTTKVKEEVTKAKVIVDFAQKNNMMASEKEIDDYLNNKIKDIKETDEFPMYDEASKELGTTFEAILKMNRNLYRFTLTKNKVYDFVTKNVDDKNSKKIIWKNFEENLMQSFKGNVEYNKFNSQMKVYDSLKKQSITDGSKVKKELLEI